MASIDPGVSYTLTVYSDGEQIGSYSIDTSSSVLSNLFVSPIKNGYSLVGFAETENGDAIYTMSSTIGGNSKCDIVMFQDKNIYAVWQKNLTFKEIQSLVSSGEIKKRYSIGDQIFVNWKDVRTNNEATYIMKFDVVNFGLVELENGCVVNGMYLQLHNVLPLNTPYDAAEPENSDSNIKAFGSNRWLYSNVRQFLNSSGSNWFKKQTTSDTLHTAYTDVEGFLSGFDKEFLSIINPIKIKTQTNSGDIDITYDSFFLPSLEQCFINPLQEFNVTKGIEGSAWSYYKQLLNDSEASYGNTYASLIKTSIDDDSARFAMLRSANCNFSHYISRINNNGLIAGTNASGNGRISPACVICANKSNKYLVSESELTYLADIIRDVTGTTDKLSFPDGFINAINCIKKIIGFTVDDKTYQARQDMTWQEFVNSNYNVNSFVITSGKIEDANNNFIVLSSNSAYSISGDSKIIENAKYISSNIVKD